MDNSSLFEVEDEARSNTARGSDHDGTRRAPADGDQGLLLTTETEATPPGFMAAVSAGAEGEAEVLDIGDGQDSGDEDWTGDDVPEAPAVTYEERTPGPANLQPARLALNVGTYLTAFAFFAVVYTFDVSLVPAAIAVGLVTLLLSVEVLREAEADPLRALVYAAVIGIVVAEARWDLYFLPLESYLAAVFLLLVFYLGSCLVQHHLT